jgi:hypothetical protein
MIERILFAFILFLSCVQREPLIISANINTEQEVPSTNSLAFGALYAVVGRDQDFMSVRVSVSCIDSVVSSHLHYAPRGQKGNFEGKAAGWTFDKFIQEIIAGNCYINIHTVKHRSSEIRGQLERFR